MTEDEILEKNLSNVRSLGQKHKQQKAVSRKEYLELPERIRELEEDVLRLIDMVLVLEETSHYQERIIRRLLRLLSQGGKVQQPAESSSDEEAEKREK